MSVASAPTTFPRLRRVRQDYPRTAPIDVRAAVAREFEVFRPRVKRGARIAVGVGSRGITQLGPIVRAVLDGLKALGAEPFIIPAMGSHGGATPDGQIGVLGTYDITEAAMGVPIRASLDVKQVGALEEGDPVWCSTEALGADGIVFVNRIKPHTDFFSLTLGSGMMKMVVVGLGKRAGAAAMHAAASRIGHERAIRGMAGVLLRRAPILGGLAILENQFHETARLVAMPAETIETGESALLAESRALMPLLPFEEIDLLIVDRIGKNISGTGMDPNVINRSIDGYSSWLARGDRPAPFIKRIFVRDLTPETHGNAIGIGLADATTARLVRDLDPRITAINALTAFTPQSAKLPIAFDTDREAIERLIVSLALPEGAAPRIVRIADTLSVAEMEISEALWPELARRPRLLAVGEPRPMTFDGAGNLTATLDSGPEV